MPTLLKWHTWPNKTPEERRELVRVIRERRKPQKDKTGTPGGGNRDV